MCDESVRKGFGHQKSGTRADTTRKWDFARVGGEVDIFKKSTKFRVEFIEEALRKRLTRFTYSTFEESEFKFYETKC